MVECIDSSALLQQGRDRGQDRRSAQGWLEGTSLRYEQSLSRDRPLGALPAACMLSKAMRYGVRECGKPAVPHSCKGGDSKICEVSCGTPPAERLYLAWHRQQCMLFDQK